MRAADLGLTDEKSTAITRDLSIAEDVEADRKTPP